MKKKFFLWLFIFTTLGLFVYAYIVLKDNNSEYQPQSNLQAPIEIPHDSILTLKEAEKKDKPIVVMFYVDWCSYCRKFMPVFAELSNEYKNDYVFAAVNCDLPENMPKIKKYHILAFPSLFIIDNKINHSFSLNIASTTDKNIMKEDLDNYLKVRKKINTI